MYKSQCDPREVEYDASEWMLLIVSTLVILHCNPNFILKMDQPLVKFVNWPQGNIKIRTITITIFFSEGDNRWCAVAITITSLRIQLPNMVIFHDKATGWIARNELATFPAGVICAMQEKSLDGCSMHACIGWLSFGTIYCLNTSTHHTHHLPWLVVLSHDDNCTWWNWGLEAQGPSSQEVVSPSASPLMSA